MNRRDFLCGLAAGPALLALARSASAAAGGEPARLVVVMLRGAVDGLNVVIPYHEEAYYAGRPRIAVARPGKPGGGLPLDGDFALHPALSSLLPLWRQRGLAFVHAAGSPDPTRSHFEAQRYIETGTPGKNLTADGWMNRLLAAMPRPHPPAEALSIGPILPRILEGKLAVANLALGPLAAQPLPIDRPAVGEAFDRLYAGTGALAAAYSEGREARRELVADLAGEDKDADGGAPPPFGFARQACQLARLLSKDARVRLVFAALSGWDTHVNQGAATGQLATRLRALGSGLAALADGLGNAWGETVVVVISEFGRTARENGNGGTDHGHGNAIWVLGGKVKGGRVYGEWPGLAPELLYQRRDLAVTTDFRTVLAAILARHLRLSDGALDAVFPAMPTGGADMAKLLLA
jgi:uncharacterized protein (DUF1501 family)